MIDRLPLDVFYNVATSLDLPSFVGLGRVSRQLRSLFHEESICRKCIKTYAKYTREAKLADKLFISYRRAVSRISDVRDAYQLASPYSCSILACQATGFVYKQGVLCYLEYDYVRILDLHDWPRQEQTVSLRAIVYHETNIVVNLEQMRVTLLHYQDSILTILYETEDSPEASWLVAIDRRIQPPRCPRVLVQQLELRRRLFVRHSGNYLFYGTHTGSSNEHCHREWVIRGTNLETKKDFDPVQLGDFVGSDLGVTVCFEIFNDYFYAISNLTSYDVEEIDWSSFYHCVRFPVADPSEIQRGRIWRRQHSEGPINDTWTNLSLHIDEQTNEVLIVECRREWKDGGSSSMRTFYNEPFRVDRTPLEDMPDDILITQLDASNKPNYTPSQARPRLRYHPEYADGSVNFKEFILAKTKHRTYNLSCSAFLDLVNDPINYGARDRLRIRVGHRKLRSPLQVEENGNYRLRSPEYDQDERAIKDSERDIEDQGIRMWPPDDAPKELLELLCPYRTTGQVEAASDERSVVYITGPSYSRQRTIVIINFDPSVSELLKLNDPPLQPLYIPPTSCLEGPEKGKEVVAGMERKTSGSKERDQSSTISGRDPRPISTSQPLKPCFKYETARYMEIKRGFWLKPLKGSFDRP